MGYVQDQMDSMGSNSAGAMSVIEQSQNYFSPTSSWGRRKALGRTDTEIRNTTRELRRRGLGEEADKALAEPRSFTTRLFDGLQASNFAIAGGVRELQEGGTYYDAFRRGASELAASSDIFDLYTDKQVEEFFGKAPLRESFSNVLRKSADAGEEDIPTAIAGMVLDIALDPVTYASFGTGALGKIGKLAPFFNVYSAGYKSSKAILGTQWSKDLIKEGLNSNSEITQRLITIFGEGFRPNFDVERAIATTSEEGKDALRLWLDELTRYEHQKYLGSDELSGGLADIVKKKPGAFSDAGTVEEKMGIAKGFTENLSGGVKIKDFVVSLSNDLMLAREG